MAYALAPVANFTQFFDNLGKPLSGGKLFTYAAGSFSTFQTTYEDDVGYVPNPNPVVLDSSGRLPGAVWINTSLSYQFVLTKSDGTTVLMVLDDIGAPDSYSPS